MGKASGEGEGCMPEQEPGQERRRPRGQCPERWHPGAERQQEKTYWILQRLWEVVVTALWTFLRLWGARRETRQVKGGEACELLANVKAMWRKIAYTGGNKATAFWGFYI